MSRSSRLIQECPVCGRPLSVCSIHLGRWVACQHCGGRFLASKPTDRNGAVTAEVNTLLQRAEQLIDSAARRLAAASPLVASAGN